MPLLRIPCDTWHDILHGKTSRAVRQYSHAGTAADCSTLHRSSRAWCVRCCILRSYVVSAPKPRTSRRHCAGAHGLSPPTSAPGLGSPRTHLRRDWAHPAHICTRTGLTPPTSAPGLGSPRPHLYWDYHGAQHRDVASVSALLHSRALHRCAAATAYYCAAATAHRCCTAAFPSVALLRRRNSVLLFNSAVLHGRRQGAVHARVKHSHFAADPEGAY